MTIAFELTCLQILQAKRRSPQRCSSGCSPARTSIPLAVVDLGVGVLDEEAAEHAAVVPLSDRRAPALAVLEDARRGFCLRISAASAVYSGAISTSTNSSARRLASGGSTRRFTATTPP
jgi:hypothetical protein